MSKLTQKQLLEASFWDKFAPALRQSIAVGKEIAKVVAPETYSGIKSAKDWYSDVKRKYAQAGKSKDERTAQFLLAKGLYPLPDPSKARIAWVKDEDDPDILIGTLKVGKAGTEFDKTGKPQYVKIAEFPSGPEATVQYDKNSKQISIVRSPYTRNLKPIYTKDIATDSDTDSASLSGNP